MYTIPRPFLHSFFRGSLDIGVTRNNYIGRPLRLCRPWSRLSVRPSVSVTRPGLLPARRVAVFMPPLRLRPPSSDVSAAEQGAGDQPFPDSTVGTVHRRDSLSSPRHLHRTPCAVAHRMPAAGEGEEQTNGGGSFPDRRERSVSVAPFDAYRSDKT